MMRFLEDEEKLGAQVDHKPLKASFLATMVLR